MTASINFADQNKMEEDFVPDQYQALLIGVNSYEEFRKGDATGGRDAFNDMKEASNELRTVTRMLEMMDFKSENIHVLDSPEPKQIKEAMHTLLENMWINYMNGQKTLVFFYFNGHAAVDADLQLILNRKENPFFPIEKLLKIIANMRDSYVLSLFDCSRIRKDLATSVVDPDATSLSPQMMALFESHNCFKSKTHSNIIQSFMVKPTMDIKAKPVNSVFYFKHLMLGKDKDGKVLLPERIASYPGSDKDAEYSANVKQNLIMTWKGIDYGNVTFHDEKESNGNYFRGTKNHEGKKHGHGFLKFESGTTYEGEF